MKKILLLSLFFSISLNAQLTSEQEKVMKNQAQQYLKSQGILYLGEGVHLVKKQNMMISKKELDLINNQQEIIKKGGYIKSNNSLINEIKNLKNLVDTDLVTNNNSSLEDNHWKKNIKDINLSWKFKPIIVGKILGYAPISSYSQAWNGVVVALKFGDNYSRYEEKSIQANHSSINLPEEYTTKDVNNKPTMIWVEGNPNDGFLYQIQWFDNLFSHELSYVDNTYSKEKLYEVINIARTIDNR
jgi:hypothetical protein